MNDLLRGAAAGLAGTVAMSASMAFAKSTGLMPGETPPRKVARNLEDTTGVRERLSGPAFEVSWVGQHLAYGAAAGIAYSPIRRREHRLDPAAAGTLYGVALWAFGYAGWLPMLELHPPPSHESKRRVGSLLASHLV